MDAVVVCKTLQWGKLGGKTLIHFWVI